MNKVACIILCIFAIGVGCAHTGGQNSNNFNFTVDVPTGWFPLDTNKYLIIVKDNADRQYAFAQQRPLNKPFTHTKKHLKAGMVPEEIARVVIDELSADNHNIRKFKLLENKPTTISGHKGFKISYTYQNVGGYHYRTDYYGFIEGDMFYNIRYCSLTRFYSESLVVFKQVLDSFKLKSDSV